MNDQLLELLTSTGTEIQNVIRNFKKDPQSRKENAKYFTDRLTLLNKLHEEFKQKRDEIDIDSIPRDHDFFKKDYYNSICSLVGEYKDIFMEQIKDLKRKELLAATERASSSNQRDQHQQGNTTSQNGATTEHTDTTLSNSSNMQPMGIFRRFNAKLSALERFLERLDNEDSFQSRHQLSAKKESLLGLWRQLEELYDSILDNFENPTVHGFHLQNYIDLETKVQDHLIQLSSQPSSSIQTPPQAVGQPSLPLPKLVIPTFDGSYLKWNQFYDIFSHMVDRQSLPNVQKMYYLKSNVTGEAERLINHFAVTDENYNSAWALLQDRYNNKRLLASSLVQKLLNQPSENGTAGSIKALHDTTQECLLALENIGIQTQNWDVLLLQILIKKLDRNTHIRYEQSISRPKDIQSIQDFLTFLELQFQSLEALGTKGKVQPTNTLTSIITQNSKLSFCKVCRKDKHPLFACKEFLAMVSSDRLNYVRKEKLCVNCLKPGHIASDCSSRNCTICNKKHNTLLHLQNKSENNQSSNNYKSKADSTPATVMTASTERNGYILLGTVQLNIKTADGTFLKCRAILDSGSQINLITEKFAKKLHIAQQFAPVSVEGIGQRKSSCQHFITTSISSLNKEFISNIKMFTIPKIIANQPSLQLDCTSWNLPSNLQFADPSFNKPGEIDLLIGAELYHHILRDGRIQLSSGLPILQNTVLGWMCCGKIEDAPERSLVCGICSEDEEALDTILTKFWALDDVQTKNEKLTIDERKCEDHFALTTTRNNQGRFIVRIPFKADKTSLGESAQMATNRFHSLEQRLMRKPALLQQYIQFMREYEQLGHMEKLPEDDMNKPRYIIPHHCVLKLDSTTTKLRVVFDASAKTSTGLSLNDITYSGPVVQSDLSSILLRFRTHRFVFTTDVEKMYRQILIHPKDQNYQVILWRERPEDKLQLYRLTTVTYGTRSAPYLATKCLQHLAVQNMNAMPLGSLSLQRDFYVDDGLTGSNSLAEALEIKRQLIKITSSAGFNLRKWCANHIQLLEDTPPQDQEVNLDLDDESSRGSIKTLGLTWLPRTDDLCIKATPTFHNKITKRTVTSEMARIYDPLGLVAPVIVKAKIFIQELWQMKIDWDAEIPKHCQQQWIKFRQELNVLNDLRIPRHISKHKQPKVTELHIFTDASEKAYGAAAYVRSENNDGTIVVQLLCSKSRVAPLKTQTIPRLELCAALLGSELKTRVQQDLQWNNSSVYMWTDSEIVLHWINSEAASFQTFVSHRISKIQELTMVNQWRHVSSKNNPADIVSRGLSPVDIKECSMWFYGPLFLHGHKTSWPQELPKRSSNNSMLEVKTKATVLITSTKTDLVDLVYKINHHACVMRLKRILGYMQRFISNSRLKREHRATGRLLKRIELDNAMVVILKALQQGEFQEDIKQLTTHKQLKANNSLASLTPFLDSHGLIRVGGRLQNSDLPYDARHPVLLPYNDPIVKLLMTHLHVNNLHCAPQALLAQTRQKYWPIKGKLMARSVVQHCIRCTRAKPQMFNQIMGNLPENRVTVKRPFLNTGVDFCGPIKIHYKLRGKRPTKAYIAVFCCFATKAIHLELVSDLTTDAFIGALNRFIFRRGRCENIYCDNATNFVGAKNKLLELKDAIFENKSNERIHNYCSQKGIEFHFIPPRAPHFGGLWEAAVKSAKHLLVKSIGDVSLTYEELETVIVQIEGILNSRPLTPMSSDPNDLAALTPGHFLIGEPLTAHPSPDTSGDKQSTLQRWKLVSHLKDQFWTRWSNEYLNELQQRKKWKTPSPNIEPGTMVIIKEDNTPPLRWPLGRITQTFQGEDGLVRVAEVKTATGSLKRAIHRLAPLFPEEYNEKPLSPRKFNAEETIPPIIKRRKVNSSLYLATIITVIMCLPLILCSSVKITNFPNQPGIHFESMGKLHPLSSHWNLVIYYDLQPLKTELEMMNRGIKTLKVICSHLHHEICDDLLPQFVQTASELKVDENLLSSTRVKRGALNIVGNIANSLFGVLDSEYAETMSQSIKEIGNNEQYLLALLKNHTSIIDSTINVMKINEEKVKTKFDSIDKAIDELKNTIITNNKTINQQSTLLALVSLTIHLIISTTNIQRAQTMILNVLTDAHHGQVGPLLLSPQQFKSEINKIKAHLPPTMKLPVQENDLIGIYRLMSIQGALTADHVFFTATIPLIGTHDFNIYKVHPIPVKSNNTMIAIQPTTEFIAITAHGDSYFPLTQQQINSCIMLREQLYLCQLQQPIHHKGSASNSCEINFFNNETKLSCQVTEVLSEHWVQLDNKNQWIFALNHPIKFTAVCGSDTSQFTLKESGILELQPECTIKHDQFTLVGHYNISSSIIPSITTHNTWSQLHDPKTLEPILLEKTLKPYDLELKELLTLQDALKKQQILQLPDDIQKINYHMFGVGYTSLILLITIILYLVIRRYQKRPQQNIAQPDQPQPAPRRQDFSINC